MDLDCFTKYERFQNKNNEKTVSRCIAICD